MPYFMTDFRGVFSCPIWWSLQLDGSPLGLDFGLYLDFGVSFRFRGRFLSLFWWFFVVVLSVWSDVVLSCGFCVVLCLFTGCR